MRGIGDRLRSAALGAAVRGFVALGWKRPLALLYAGLVEERLPGGGRRRVPRRSSDTRPVLLALSAEQFRGDLQCFADEGTFRVLELHANVQRKLIYRFFPAETIWPDIINPKDNEALAVGKRQLRTFFAGLLPHLYERLGVDCVLSPHLHYDSDIDWGAVSQQLGVLYVVLHRENLYACPRLVRFIRDRFASLDTTFEGEHIVVHNEIVRQVFIDNGFVAPEAITALGCMRMDLLVERLRRHRRTAVPRRVTLFPFAIPSEREESGRRLRMAFDRLHVALVTYAEANPDVEVVIKPKEKWAAQFHQNFERAMDGAGLNANAIPNLIVRDDLDAQDLIFSSAVVVGLNTTTLIEAGVARCRAVIPYFEAMQHESVDDRIYFRDRFDNLIVATDEDELYAEFARALAGEALPEAVHQAYCELFETYVSTLQGTAVPAYVASLKQLCDFRRTGEQTEGSRQPVNEVA